MGIFELSTDLTFSAAHRLLNYEGSCSRLHGHNWKVELTLRGKDLDRSGILIDFRRIRACLSEVIAELDHQYLNELPAFADLSPSAENLARWISDELRGRFTELKNALYCVRVWENERSVASYYPDETSLTKVC